MTNNNSIGNFAIDQSQIGSIVPFSVYKTVISQYANSPILMSLVENVAAYFDQTASFESFFDNVWNIDTAVGVYLDLWGRVLGVQRVVPVLTGVFFGFQEQGTAHTAGFDRAPFYSGQSLTNNYALSDDSFRKLLLIKAAFNLTDCTIASINQLLLALFPNRGHCFVTDNGNMSMTYTFQFALSPLEQSIIVSSGVLPRPSGVSVTYT